MSSISMSDQSHLLDSTRTELAQDYVGLWSIVREVRESTSDSNRVRELTLSLIRQLLEDPHVVAGEFVAGKFVRSSESPAILINRIESQWKSGGREPDIGEIVWFAMSIP